MSPDISQESLEQDLFPGAPIAGALHAAFERRECDRAHEAAAAPRPDGSPPGTRERYEVQGEIARGGMGVILGALDRELSREVVLRERDGWGGVTR